MTIELIGSFQAYKERQKKKQINLKQVLKTQIVLNENNGGDFTDLNDERGK